MLKLTSPVEINKYFSKWHEYTEAERLQTIRDLRTVVPGVLGSLTGKLTIVPNGKPVTTDFRCPLNGFTVARPCNLSSCQYYIGPKKMTTDGKKRVPKAEILEAQQTAAAGCKNCLILCLDRAKNGRLSAQEVATVRGISVSEVNSINNNAIAKIRRATIRERIEKLQLPRFKYLDGFCVSCGLCIEDELELNTHPELSVVVEKHGWCSEGCRDDKPKWQFQIEREFECDYLDALAVGLSTHGNLDTLGNMFGVPNESVKEYEKDIRKQANYHSNI